MGELPDAVIGFMGANWGKIGMVPAIVYRLVEERGIPREALDEAMDALVGPDWAQVNVSTWIDRRIEAGDELMKKAMELPYDSEELPVIDVMEKAIRKWLGGR